MQRFRMCTEIMMFCQLTKGENQKAANFNRTHNWILKSNHGGAKNNQSLSDWVRDKQLHLCYSKAFKKS